MSIGREANYQNFTSDILIKSIPDHLIKKLTSISSIPHFHQQNFIMARYNIKDLLRKIRHLRVSDQSKGSKTKTTSDNGNLMKESATSYHPSGLPDPLVPPDAPYDNWNATRKFYVRTGRFAAPHDAERALQQLKELKRNQKFPRVGRVRVAIQMHLSK